MTEALILPVEVKRGQQVLIVMPTLILSSIVIYPALCYYLTKNSSVPTAILLVICLFTVLMNVAISFFLLWKLKPAQIHISNTSITVTPIPVLGIAACKYENRSLSEFKNIDVETVQAAKGSIVHRLWLRAKNGDDINFSLPPSRNAEVYGRSLAEATKLSFSTKN